MAVDTVTETSTGPSGPTGPDTRSRTNTRWERRYRREQAAAFATVPHYRALWSATSLGEPTSIEVAQACLPELFPLRADRLDEVPASRHGLRRALRMAGVREPSEIHDVCGPLPTDARPGAVLYHRLLGYPAALADCGSWHIVHQHFYFRPLSDAGAGMLAVTALRADGPRLVDITLGPLAPAHLSTCPRHGSPTVAA